jgi:DNA-binding response OmpR family regulator
MTRRVVALVDDFMVRSRIEAAATSDTELSFPRGEAELVAQLEPPPDLILVGMAATRLPWPELIRLVRARTTGSVPILAFGPHKDLALRARALEAGADRVLANSALMLAQPELLRGEVVPDEGGE